MLVILVNKKKVAAVAIALVIITVMAMLYKPYLRKFEYPLYMKEQVLTSAERYGVDPYLIWSVMKAESKFRADAISVKGAQGLMQITPETAKWAMEKMGIKGNVFDPDINIEVGSWYLSKLLSDYDGNLTAALAAYNAGGSNVNKWMYKDRGLTLKDIQFEETYDYVYKTLQYYKNYKKLYLKGE